MDKFNSKRLELLKVKFYQTIGALEIEKNIKISDIELKVFETSLRHCQNEMDSASCILGAIRRYSLFLKNQDQTIAQDGIDSQPEVEHYFSNNYFDESGNSETHILSCVEVHICPQVKVLMNQCQTRNF